MIRKDFPADDMMYELHVLRACMAVRDGYAKIEDILPSTPVAAASAAPKPHGTVNPIKP